MPNARWSCIECGDAVRFETASAMHFDMYGHTPYMLPDSVPDRTDPDQLPFEFRALTDDDKIELQNYFRE